MLAFLQNRTSDRKLRLFAVACCRRVWNLLTDERSREAVKVAERWADGLTTRKEVVQTRVQARAAAREHKSVSDFSDNWRAKQAVAETLGDEAATAACRVAHLYRRYPAKLAEYLREVIGNPFQPVSLSPAWLTPTVLAIAQRVYEERDFAALPILADALEEAGCTVPDLLNHLRGPGPHLLGCWALDLVRSVD